MDLRLRAALTLIALVGCTRASPTLFLEIDDDTRAVLMVAAAEDEVVLRAFDVEADRPLEPVWDRYIGAYPVRITTLAYTTSLEGLGFIEGVVPLVEQGRSLPSTDRMHTALVEGDAVTGFEPVQERPATVAALRIASTVDLSCVEGGGCYVADTEGPCIEACPVADPPTPPMPARRPQILPCGAGFSPRTLDPDIEVCEAFVNGRDRSCPIGQAHFVDTDGCSRIGPECGAGTFADGVPSDAIFVQAGASGNGSRASPYGTLAEALAVAMPGQTIALASGRYVGSFVMDGLRIVGTCVSRTTIARDPAGDGRLSLLGVSSLERLRLEENGVVVEEGAVATLRGVEVYRSRVSAIRSTTTSSITLESVVVTQPALDGLSLWSGPSLTARRLIVTGVRGHAAIVHDATLNIDSAVFDAITVNDNELARAIGVQGSARVTVRNTAMIGVYDAAVFVDDSTALFEGVVVKDSLPTGPDADDGYGFFLQNDADVTIRRSWIHQNRHANVFANAPVTIEDTVLSNALPQAGGDVLGIGMQGVGSTEKTLRRVAVLDSAYHGIQLSGAGDFAEDIIVRRTGIQRADRREGRGISVNGAAVISRVEIEDTQGAAIQFVSTVDGGEGIVSNVRVTRAGLHGCAACGGVCASEDVSLSVLRARIEAVSGLGLGHLLFVGLGARLALMDIEVVGTRGPEDCTNADFVPLLSHGVGVQAIGGIELGSFVIAGSASTGLALPAGSSYAVSDGTIQGNRVGVLLGDRPSQPWRLFNRVRVIDNDIALASP